MPQLFSTRSLLVLFCVFALSCSSKKEDATPVAPPISMTGTWELTKQVITEFHLDGTSSSTIYNTYVATGELWHYVLTADGSFDYNYKGQTSRKGTYTSTNSKFIQTNAPGFGNTPTVTFTIQKLTTTELVLVSPAQTATGTEVATTWEKR